MGKQSIPTALQKIKSVLPGKETAQTKTTYKSVFILSIALIGLIAPFIHIPWTINDTEGIFGFKHMSSFLFALGLPIVSISAGILFYLVTKFLSGSIKTTFLLIGYAFSYVGIFFILWTILMPPKEDFHPIFYFLSIISLAVLGTYIVMLFSKYAFNALSAFQSLLKAIGEFRITQLAKSSDQDENSSAKKEKLEILDDLDKKIFQSLEEITKN